VAGQDIGRTLKNRQKEIDLKLVVRDMEDIIMEGDPLVLPTSYVVQAPRSVRMRRSFLM
jgi:hypothetical protein